MGRPLNKRLFGEPTAAGSEIKVNFHNGTAVKEGYIVKQKGSKKFVCEEIETAGEFTCTLTTGVLPANLTAGQMAISFNMDDSETYGVSKITGRKATLVAHSATGTNLYEGNSVPWNFATSTSDGAAQVEEAGDDNTLTGTDDDDFTEDA
tara:strand:- start:9549 stop:9998 length:450 start_codon:yes stop_codon:yes gene_type:complete